MTEIHDAGRPPSPASVAVGHYLDDLARMLATADPAERADVLGGVREHVDARLAELGREPTEADVAAILAALGSPEQVARESFADASGRQQPVPAPAPPPARRGNALGGSWVAPVATLLLLVGFLGSVLVLPWGMWLAGAVLLGLSPLWSGREKAVAIGTSLAAGIGTVVAGLATFLVTEQCVEAAEVGVSELVDGELVTTVVPQAGTACSGGPNVAGILLLVVVAALVLFAAVYLLVLLRRGLARAATPAA